ncbi:hypothetical protein AB0936_03550 [Streptomyces cyaneofuscatus]|uniref:phage tail termination protein n=1 Tax=Streptomyces cyaneofuscatus TaxID=66883 RepID=UPI0004CB329A|nr:hypothetical protein [Streptomyces cyaneofuscatus]
MAISITVFPDAELMAMNFLAEYFGEDAFVCSTAPDAEHFEELLPIVRVSRIGGVWRVRKALDEPSIDVDVWSTDAALSHSLVNRARGALEAMVGDQRDGGLVTFSSEISGPGRRPDENPKVYRVGFTVGLCVRPA